MIVTELANTNPYGFSSGLATKLNGTSIPSFEATPTSDICICDYQCDYTEYVFGEVGGDFYKNDKNSFLFRKLIAADTITIKLFKGGVLAATIVDDTYGEYFATFTAQPLYVGFIVHWEKVINLLGPGRYQIQADKDIYGNLETFESRFFQLLPYSDLMADNTVRVETFQNGNILRSEFDYTDLNWYQSFRIRGRFGDNEPSLEVDEYLNQVYEKKQIQDKVVNNWTCSFEFVPKSIFNMFTQDGILGNSILITDFNILNQPPLRRIPVRPSEISEVTNHKFNVNVDFIVKFTDDTDDLRKRNF